MAKRKIKDAKDLTTNELFYFKGHAKATYMSNGDTVENAVNSKVDKVDGKQLSTEDFTTILKQKLDGLSNYDDTAISQAVDKLRKDLDALVSGDTTTAIKTFNEVIAFLDGISDTEDLSGIIASIEQQIAGKQDKINDIDNIRSGAAKGANSTQQEILQTGVSAVVVHGGVFVDGGGSTYALPDIDETTKETSDYVLASEAYVDSKVESGGIYLTPFTVEQFCTGYVELTDKQRNGLLNAASQNRIIGMPYNSFNTTGHIVADYEYYLSEDVVGNWWLKLGITYNATHYSNIIRHDNPNFVGTRATITPFNPLISIVVVENGVADVSEISTTDNHIFGVEGECTELVINLEPSVIGKTVRFFTGESCTLAIAYPVYWANGEIPTLEPYTHYELSLVVNMEGVFNAVLTPFKAVE